MVLHRLIEENILTLRSTCVVAEFDSATSVHPWRCGVKLRTNVSPTGTYGRTLL